MISIFILLILSHALADFVFQTGRLYQWKVKSNWGVFVHVLIFAATAKLLTWPMVLDYPLFWVWLVFVAISHFVIDKAKLLMNPYTIKDETSTFILDQIAHIAVLMTVFFLPFPPLEFWFRKASWISWVIDKIPYFGSWPDVMLLSLAVFLGIYVAYAVSVLLFYYDRMVNPSIHRLNYQWFPMIYRLVLFGLLITSWRPLVLIPMLVHLWRVKHRLVFDRRRFWLEYGLLMALWIIFEGMKRSLL